MSSFIRIKQIIRSAGKKKGLTALSILGMTLGISVALLIGLWAMNEFSFDRFHRDADRIYRICRDVSMNGEMEMAGTDFAPVAPAAKEKFPEVEDMTRLEIIPRELVKANNRSAFEEHICAADPNFFQFFSFRLKTGNPETCLSSNDQVVIDQHLADKYFSGTDPVGRLVEVHGKTFQVSAVMENIPDNSHIRPQILLPVEAIDLRGRQWGMNDNYIGYLKLRENADPEALAPKITRMVEAHIPGYAELHVHEFLQPLKDIHFSSFRFDYAVTSDKRIIFILVSIAALILLIAVFNFINLFISTVFLRARSIGMKKISGSSRKGLFFESYLETAVYIFISMLLAVLAAGVALPGFNQMAGSRLSLDLTHPALYLYLGTLFLITVFLAGTIPVFYILRFNPVAIIRNRFRGEGVTLLQRALVISQFAASIVLIISVTTIQKQITFVRHKDLGFNKEQVICFTPFHLAKNYDQMREELIRNSCIRDVTAKYGLPMEQTRTNGLSKIDRPNEKIMMEYCYIAFNYPEVMQIPVVSGKNPFEQGRANRGECLINEKAAKALGFTDPVGKTIRINDHGDRECTIAGVLKDADLQSLHFNINPQIYLLNPHVDRDETVLVRTTGDNNKAIQLISGMWEKSNPDIPFEYHFLDAAYDKLYQTEDTASRIVFTGMLIAVLLSFMGLFAISHYAAERRVKEIGIRKVNGARIDEVMVLLNQDFVKWIVISFLIAAPVAWYAMHRWLENFAYKTSLSWWIFALAGVLALGIALLTVSWQSWKASTRNPVEALRYE